MTENCVLQKTSVDGKYRISVYRDEYPENPLEMCDIPLQYKDWCRNYTMMACNKKGAVDFDNARKCLEYLLRHYGNRNRIINRLKDNIRPDSHDEFECAFVYNHHRKTWELLSWCNKYTSYKGDVVEAHWDIIETYQCKEKDLDLYDLLYDVTDECITDLAQTCLNDNVKIMSYGFGYYGDVSFYDSFSSDSDGLIWIEYDDCVGDKKWFTQQQWDNNKLRELIKDELEDIEAYSEGRVYWYKVEKSYKWSVHRECLSEPKPNEDYEVDEWDIIDSCAGFYGDENYAFEFAINANGLKDQFDEH